MCTYFLRIVYCYILFFNIIGYYIITHKECEELQQAKFHNKALQHTKKKFENMLQRRRNEDRRRNLMEDQARTLMHNHNHKLQGPQIMFLAIVTWWLSKRSQ
jgi:hypothetical protein